MAQKRGRPPIDGKILALRGSRHQRPEEAPGPARTDAGPQPAREGQRPPCPRWLAPGARVTFRAICTALEVEGRLSEVDRGLIAGAAEALAEFREAVERLAEDGAVVVYQGGHFGPSPWAKIRDSAFRRFRYALADLGLRPSERARFQAAAESEVDELEAFDRRHAQ